MNPYEVLGVDRAASAEEVRRAYLQLARAHHPDFFVDAPAGERAGAEARMRAINEAWAVLGDPPRRRSHDGERPAPFQPLSPDDDEPDPRLAPDVPYRPVAPPRARDRIATLGPVLLFVASVAIGGVGLVASLLPLVAFAFVLFLLSCVGFLVVPLLALSRARQDEG